MASLAQRLVSSPYLTVPGAIAAYFCSSIFLTFFQKSMMRAHHFPAFIVILHVIMKFIFASAVRSGLECHSGRPRVVLPFSRYLSKVLLVGVFSAIDIMFSQWSLEYITITLYTLTKTTSVLWLLGFAILLRLEKLDFTLVLIVVMIASGLFMFVYHYTEFHLFGFLIVLTAAVLSGVRWTFSQTVMQRSQLGLENPVDFMYHIQPVMLITLVPFLGALEGWELAASEEGFRFHDLSQITRFAGLIAVGGAVAFVMELFEFLIVFKSSGLTLSIVGAVKEVFTIFLDAGINGGDFSTLNKIGMVVCLTGVALHVFRKVKMGDSSDGGGGGSKRSTKRYGGRRSNVDSLPLLDRDEFSSSEDDEIYHEATLNGKLPKSASTGSFREPDDDFYLKERREWRSTRDLHLAMAGGDASPSPAAMTGDDVPAVLRDSKWEIEHVKKEDLLLPGLDLSDSD